MTMLSPPVFTSTHPPVSGVRPGVSAAWMTAGGGVVGFCCGSLCTLLAVWSHPQSNSHLYLAAALGAAAIILANAVVVSRLRMPRPSRSLMTKGPRDDQRRAAAALEWIDWSDQSPGIPSLFENKPR
jgi:hypothetical protein